MKRLLVLALLLALPACDDEPDPECEKQQKIALTAIQAGMERDRVEAIFESAAPEGCDWPLE